MRSARRPAICVLWLVAAIFDGGAAVAAGQDAPGAAARPASAGLPVDHWAVDVAWRLQALGLLETALPERGVLSRTAVARALEEAAGSTSADAPRWAAAVDDWTRRFREEFGEYRAAVDTAGPWLGGRLGAGLAFEGGRVGPGFGDHPPQRTGPVALADRGGAVFGGAVEARLGGHVAAEFDAGFDHGRLLVRRAGLALGSRRWTLAAGRGEVAYGPARGGAVVLSGAAPIDRVQIETARPLRMPWPVRFLGSYSFHAFVSRLAEERHEREPYFWGASGSLHPHPRVALGVHRAAMFGGDYEHRTPLTPRLVWSMLLGDVEGRGFEDQIVSVSGRFRLPTERVVPLTVYLEWGAEDAAGAWRNVPGRVAGVHVPALPALPALAATVEVAQFGRSCCGNPKWYRHAAFPGSWAWRERPLGHPLGGAGRELLGRLEGHAGEARLRWRARVFVRERYDDNLFAPEREGRSSGFGLQFGWRATPRLDVASDLAGERGRGWRDGALSIGAHYLF